MPDSTKISVVIPAYNAANTIAETLDSLSSQTRAADEIIVVDDGSTDATSDVVVNHPVGAKVVKQSNSGAAAAFNNGIGNASGDYIALLDADDIWTPEKLQVQEAALQVHGTGAIILGHVEAFECPSQPSELFANLAYVKGKTPGYLAGTVLVRRDLIAGEAKCLDTSLRTGYFIEWYRRRKSEGVETVMLDDLVMRRRIRANTLSRRQTSTADGLSKDFLEIARRAILEKKQQDKTG
ncbi:MAG: glycosyltransferase family A protein [Pseudomonadota bacterium]